MNQSNKCLMTIISVLLLSISPVFSISAQVFRSRFNASDFVFDLTKGPSVTLGPGGTTRLAILDTFPALESGGISMLLTNLDPCAINLPHVHPRATELLFVLKGSMKTTFVEENGGRTIVNVVNASQTTVFPRGLIHEEHNIDCEPAAFISAFSNEDPGAQFVANSLFTIPQEAISASLNVENFTIDSLRNALPKPNIGKGTSECLARCALLKQTTNPTPSSSSTKKKKTNIKFHYMIFNSFYIISF